MMRAIEALRQKVQSKMTVVGVLAGFTASMLTTVAVSLAGPDVEQVMDRVLLQVASVLFAAATGLLVLALLAYDRLMMPQRFWLTGRPRARSTWCSPLKIGRRRDVLDPVRCWPVARPPSSAGWVLYQQSLWLWKWVMWALALVGAGCVFMLGATWKSCLEGGCTTSKPLLSAPSEEPRLYLAVAVLICVAVVVGCLGRRLGPDLGTED
jgi:hypothetical protein